MAFRLLEIIASIQWVKPGIKEKFGPFSTPYNEAALTQPLIILREHQIYLVCLQMRECLDHTVRRNDRLVLEHY